jgi:hypothetical protein
VGCALQGKLAEQKVCSDRVARCRYSKGLIKKFQCGPDAWIQMALQLAYYREQVRRDTCEITREAMECTTMHSIRVVSARERGGVLTSRVRRGTWT